MKMKLTAIKTVIMDKVSLSSLEIFDATAMIWIQTMHAEVMKKNFYVKFFLWIKQHLLNIVYMLHA